MIAVIEADEAWCPPTFTPSTFGRIWLAWWIIQFDSQSVLRVSSSSNAIRSFEPRPPCIRNCAPETHLLCAGSRGDFRLFCPHESQVTQDFAETSAEIGRTCQRAPGRNRPAYPEGDAGGRADDRPGHRRPRRPVGLALPAPHPPHGRGRDHYRLQRHHRPEIGGAAGLGVRLDQARAAAVE